MIMIKKEVKLNIFIKSSQRFINSRQNSIRQHEASSGVSFHTNEKVQILSCNLLSISTNVRDFSLNFNFNFSFSCDLKKNIVHNRRSNKNWARLKSCCHEKSFDSLSNSSIVALLTPLCMKKKKTEMRAREMNNNDVDLSDSFFFSDSQ